MLVVNCGSPRVPEIVSHLKAQKCDVQVVSLDLLQPHHLRNVEGIVISGSFDMISEQNMDYIERYSFLREADVPILGICFGHQLLGVLHGADIGKSKPDSSWIQGNREIWLENSRLFTDVKPVSMFQQFHQEEISLPENFVLLGSSDETRVEAMCHQEKPIYGVQFHPEISGDVGTQIFDNFVNNICADKPTPRLIDTAGNVAEEITDYA